MAAHLHSRKLNLQEQLSDIYLTYGALRLTSSPPGGSLHITPHWSSLKQKSLHFLPLPDSSSYGHHVSQTSYVLCDDPPTIQRIFSRLRSFGGAESSYPQDCGGVPVLQVRDVTTGYDSSRPDGRSVSSPSPRESLSSSSSSLFPFVFFLSFLFLILHFILFPSSTLFLLFFLPLHPCFHLSVFLCIPLHSSSSASSSQVLPVTRNSHMITFSLQNGVVATLRTSGTEPKIKVYGEYCATPGVR